MSEISRSFGERTTTKEGKDDMEEMEAILTEGPHLERGFV